MFLSLLPPGLFNQANMSLIAKSVVGGGFMWLTIWLMEPWMQYWYLICVLSVGMYGITLFMTKAFSESEIQFFLTLIPFGQSSARGMRSE
jgi:hypothetical protein